MARWTLFTQLYMQTQINERCHIGLHIILRVPNETHGTPDAPNGPIAQR